MHLVGFIIRIYHDARSSERQIGEEPLPVPLCPQEVSHKTSCGVDPGPSGAKCIASVQEVVSVVEVSVAQCARYVIVTVRSVWHSVRVT